MRPKPTPAERPLEIRAGQIVLFRYRNWHGHDHLYVVRVESIEYQPKEKAFTLSGRCLLRDGARRLEPDSVGGGKHSPRRTFEITGLRDFEVVLESERRIL